MNAIGGMYERGYSVPIDCDEAVKWHEKVTTAKYSSKQDLSSTYYNLNHLYGKYGCNPDKTLERKWKKNFVKLIQRPMSANKNSTQLENTKIFLCC